MNFVSNFTLLWPGLLSLFTEKRSLLDYDVFRTNGIPRKNLGKYNKFVKLNLPIG